MMGLKMDISVITTLYNYSNFIEAAILSFEAQELHRLKAEMIIVDDGSTDNPLEVISPYLNIVDYIKLDENKGYSYAKNIGIKAAKGKYIVMLDADDALYGSASLINRYKKIEQGYDLVHGPVYDSINGLLNPSPLWQQWIKSKQDAKCYKYIHAQSVMLKRDIHREIGLYDETLRFKSDREMWARIMNHKFKVGYINDFVSIYVQHPNQMHKSDAKKKINESLQKEVEDKIEKRKTDLRDLTFLE